MSGSPCIVVTWQDVLASKGLHKAAVFTYITSGFCQDSVMPSQEPQLDDKNDEADLPSEETDGSEYFLVKLEFTCFLMRRPSFHSTHWGFLKFTLD